MHYISKSLKLAGFVLICTRLTAVFFWTPAAWAQGPFPQIAAVSGSITHNGAVTLSGSDFGAKPQGPPTKQDYFESGGLGLRVGNGWFTWSNIGGHEPKYSSSQARQSTRAKVAAYQDFSAGAYNSTIGLIDQAIRTLYVSGWFYNTVAGNKSRNFKWFALRAGAGDAWNSPNVRMDAYPDTNSGHIYTAEEAAPVCDGTGNADHKLLESWTVEGNTFSGAWHRFEFWFKSDSTGPNGRITAWRDLQTWATDSGQALSLDCPLRKVFMSSYFADDGVGTPRPTMNFYWDELYIDNTLARVELCNSPQWASRQHCEIQLPVTWSANTITAKLNFGALPNGKAYLYVIDSQEKVNPNGYEITVGSPNDTLPPAPPKNLKVAP